MIEFFSKEEGDRIIEAIRRAELKTSGEIRVHLEVDCKKRTFENAVEVFNRLGMQHTKFRNGVLFFIVPERKEFCIYGDVGIHNKVPEGFWSEVLGDVQTKFRIGEFTEGICEGVDLIGENLKKYFPSRSNDSNELPNEISYGSR